MKAISKDQIVFDLTLCGIRPGDVILMHSSLSSIGTVEGGADTVIDAMMEVLGPEGTFAVSTLSFAEPYDPKTAPSAVGRISEVLRMRTGAFRSLHPVHSIAAIGARAEELCAGHEDCETGCGFGTPYLKLRDMGGKIVMLGVDLNRNTTLHAIEDLMNSCYLEERDVKAPVYWEDYENKIMHIIKFPPGHRDFLKFTPVLRKNGALVEGRVGKAVVRVIDVRAMFGLGFTYLADNSMFFMCSNDACDYCSTAHRKLKEGV